MCAWYNCANIIEDAYHYYFKCLKYESCRITLFQAIKNIIISSNQFFEKSEDIGLLKLNFQNVFIRKTVSFQLNKIRRYYFLRKIDNAYTCISLSA